MGAAIKADELLAYLFEEQGHDLYAPLSRWIASSRAFKTFSSEYRTKIRKKIRVTRSGPALEDLTAELAVAYELLQQKRFSVIYEPYGSEAGRGPDFAVGFKSVTFNVEVTRIQSDNLQPDGQSPGFDSQQVDGRLIDTVCDKLGQMRSGMSNVLIVVADGRFLAALDIERAMAHLKARVEKREEGLYGRYGFVKPADFFKEYLRLSAILARTRAAEEPPTPSALWLNSQSKHPLSKELKNALQRTF